MCDTEWHRNVDVWSESQIVRRLEEIKSMDWLKVSDYVSRNDDGQVGQSIERLFNVPENNREEADLQPNFELKTIRRGGNLSLKRASYSHTSMNRFDLNNNLDPIPAGIIQNASQPALTQALIDKYGHFHKKRKDYTSMTVVQLQDELRGFRLPVSGKKEILIARLKEQKVYVIDKKRKILLDSTTYNDFKSPVKKHESSGKYHGVGDEVKSDYWSLRPAKYRFVLYESSKGRIFSLKIPLLTKKGYLEIHHRDDGYIATVSIDGWSKLDKVVLCICDSNEMSKSKTAREEFKLDSAYLLKKVHSVDKLLKAGLIGEFSFDAKLKKEKWEIHNRGDAYRINLSRNPESRLKKLETICEKVKILVEKN